MMRVQQFIIQDHRIMVWYHVGRETLCSSVTPIQYSNLNILSKIDKKYYSNNMSYS